MCTVVCTCKMLTVSQDLQLEWFGGPFSRSEFIRLPVWRMIVPEEAL